MAKARNSYEVHLDAPELGVRQRVGALHRHDVRTDLAASFEYDATWLASENKFMLDPRLDLYAGEQHVLPPAAAFGVLMDSAPDRWGRVRLRPRKMAAVMVTRTGATSPICRDLGKLCARCAIPFCSATSTGITAPCW